MEAYPQAVKYYPHSQYYNEWTRLTFDYKKENTVKLLIEGQTRYPEIITATSVRELQVDSTGVISKSWFRKSLWRFRPYQITGHDSVEMFCSGKVISNQGVHGICGIINWTRLSNAITVSDF